MSIVLPLRVFKTSPIGWRTNLGGAHVGRVAAWNVEDAAGVFLAGGLSSGGNNVESARARFRLKREAMAYAAGYTAWVKGELSQADLVGGLLPYATMNTIGQALGWRGDEQQRSAYHSGVIEAKNRQRREAGRPVNA